MNIIKTYYRNFKKQKLIYGITIGGFAISLSVLVIIVSFLIEEKSVDKHLPNIKNMYRIKQADGNAQIPKRIYDPILSSAPGIEKLCLISKNGAFYEYQNKKEWALVVSTNKEFLDVFSINIIKGQNDGLLESKNDVLITESFAEKVFGDKNPLGEILEFGNREKKSVRAVIPDPDKKSSLKYDVIFNIEQELFTSTRGYNEESYKMFDAVFLLNPNANPGETERSISDILKPYEGYEEASLLIQPFKEVYFDLKGDNDQFAHANLSMIRLLSWVAFIILLLAIINYVNLTTAFNNERHKEICIRKTTGARQITIFSQFLKESYFSCFIALLFAIGIASFFSPLFYDLFGREVNILEAVKNRQIVVALILILVVVGGVTGLLPAISVSRYNPIDLLQRRTKLKKSNFRGIYNAFQLFATMSLIIGLIVIVKQINFVKTKDVGFNKEFLLSVRLQGETYSKANVIKEKLLQYPNILNVTGTNGRPFGIYSTGSGSWTTDSIEYRIENVAHMNTDTSFLSTFGIKLIKGRNFRLTDNNVCIINKKTYNYLQLDDIEGKTIWDSKIVGVAEDFHFKTMYNELGFIQLRYSPNEVTHLNIRIRGNDIPGTLSKIKSEFKEFEPGMDFDPVFYDDWINTLYKREEMQAKAIKIFAAMALILSCLGLLGLAEFTTVKQTKEIGIRKVNGAKVFEILSMLNKDYIKWVAIAFIIATPVAWYAMNKWLENFAYKTELSWWIFALAGLLALGIALLTVSFQSWKAATRNPVEALRYE
ncbi:MAG: FtsX-like permease family protein [Prolixibacteraceae bacterium]|nr:FtsX-like permease family protein [Prolixibacteraceae bacterium]MBN2773461.1 FtsX-like permease family protein [Prolixibacteraceae bacterium]